MKLSNFGEKLTNKSGILELMDDLGNALQKGGMYMLGGGNPAHIPQMDIIWKKRMQELIENGREFEKSIGDYTTPQGDVEFIEAIAQYFKSKHQFNITSKNICVLGGSQTTFFFLFNMLAGPHSDGSSKKILFPLVPEYIGYTDQGILAKMFVSNEPTIKYIDEHTFKYSVDFNKLKITPDIAAMCISRPTNPTGNVLTDEEVAKLAKLAERNQIPLIVDNAYGAPFPNILFIKTSPFWNENIIYVMSLSKIGLPSTRTSVIIASEEIIKSLTAINAIVSLSTATLGQRLILSFLKDNSINKICQDIITPFYQERAKMAVEFFHSQMDPKLPYYVHKTEGALFMWVWFKNLPISSYALYQKLKAQKVLVVPGEYFFPGMANNKLTWQDECLRITYSQDWETVKKGLEIIAKTVKDIYMQKPKTIFEKIWDSHVVFEQPDYPAILYIDAHLIHEVTTPQAFDGLRKRRLPVFRTQRTWATMDHNVPTKNQDKPIAEELSRKQVEALKKNSQDFGIRLYGLGHKNQGIVHIIGPQLGITKPGMTIVCGDSHTSTHGAFGNIAFGIGTSEVEQVLATQCILQYKPKTMNIKIEGKLNKGVVSKDIILYIISKISSSGGTRYFVEYSGSTIRSLSMEARMSICNMSIEMGARGGLIAPDETTYQYIKGRDFTPKGKNWDKALAYWKSLPSDADAKYDKELIIDAQDIEPMITYGTNPGMGVKITGSIPLESDFTNESHLNAFKKAMGYMGLKPGQKMLGQKIDYVFIGSCTNSRIEDLRMVANIVKGKKKAGNITVLVVPGSTAVHQMAIDEGLDKVFTDAGFEFRGAGCSACLGMNEDKIPAQKYCVSTSNRNFEGRQGPGARTMLASPLTAAAAAITGRVTDIREIM